MDADHPVVVDGVQVPSQVALKHGDIMEIAGRKFRYEVRPFAKFYCKHMSIIVQKAALQRRR